MNGLFGNLFQKVASAMSGNTTKTEPNDFLKRLLNYQREQNTNWNSKDVEENESISVSKKQILSQIGEVAAPLKIGSPVTGGRCTSGYGLRYLTIDGKKVKDWHYGIDLVGNDFNIRAPEDLVIKKIIAPDFRFPCKFVYDSVRGWIHATPPKGKTWEDRSWAWTPYITAVGKYTKNLYVFRHCKTKAVVGKEFNIGDVMGEYGNLGYSMGAHLHFEIYPIVNGEWPKTVDPKSILKQSGVNI